MTEFLALSLFGSFIWFALIVGAYIISLFVSDYHKNGYAASVLTVILCGVFYFEGSVAFWEWLSWSLVLAYLGIGFVFSVIRTFIFARKEQYKYLTKEKEWSVELERRMKVASNNSKNDAIVSKDELDKIRNAEEKNRSYDFREYHKEPIKNHVFRWWFLWPVSLLMWIVGDLLADLFNLIWDKMKGFYAWVIRYAESTVKLD